MTAFDLTPFVDKVLRKEFHSFGNEFTYSSTEITFALSDWFLRFQGTRSLNFTARIADRYVFVIFKRQQSRCYEFPVRTANRSSRLSDIKVVCVNNTVIPPVSSSKRVALNERFSNNRVVQRWNVSGEIASRKLYLRVLSLLPFRLGNVEQRLSAAVRYSEAMVARATHWH